MSFGFALSPWQTVAYVEYPSIGKFERDRFDPRTWRPQTPTTAYMELRDDDAFWAARRVAAFTDELIRAAVHTGEYSDPAAEGCHDWDTFFRTRLVPAFQKVGDIPQPEVTRFDVHASYTAS